MAPIHSQRLTFRSARILEDVRARFFRDSLPHASLTWLRPSLQTRGPSSNALTSSDGGFMLGVLLTV